MSRRHFLRGAGVALSLPWLEAMLPNLARAQQPGPLSTPGAKPRRMFAVMHNLGFIPANFFPTGAGRDYVPSPYLELLQTHRDDFTVFTGVSLPDVDGGHPTDVAWLTGAPHPGRGAFRNTISLDQVVAAKVGHLTRFPSLTLSVNTRGRSLSISETGKLIPPEEKASEIYKRLFVEGSPEDVRAQVLKLETGRSILDTIGSQTRVLEGTAGTGDRERLDQYFTSVRELEIRLQAQQDWAQRPKPVVDTPMPVDPPSPAQYFEKIKLMYDVATLALQTDSTRAITLFIDSVATPPVAGKFEVPITDGYLRLAYHENLSSRLGQLRALDTAHFRHLNLLLSDLKAVTEADGTLLDQTLLLWGSNFNDANANPQRPPMPLVIADGVVMSGPGQAAVNEPGNGSVSSSVGAPFTRHGHGVTTNLPIVFAGGGWKHGQHLVFDTGRNYPLTNLHLSMLHRMGIPEKSFSSSTGEFRGLEMA